MRHGVFLEEQLVGQFLRAVLRADPAQVAALGAAGAIGQLAGQFGEASRRCVTPGQLQKGLLGPHRQGMHVQAIRHRKEDVAQVDLAAFNKALFVRVVVAPAFLLARRRPGHRLVQHGLDRLLVLLGQRGRAQHRKARQQSLTHGLLAQQLTPGELGQGLRRRVGRRARAR